MTRAASPGFLFLAVPVSDFDFSHVFEPPASFHIYKHLDFIDLTKAGKPGIILVEIR
jgi:hypothetical protein